MDKGFRCMSFEVDIEKGVVNGEEFTRSSILAVSERAKGLILKVYSRLVDASSNKDSLLGGTLDCDMASVERVKTAVRTGLGSKEDKNVEGRKKTVKEKRKSLSNKKAPKPPRAPRAPSLDAADLKLVKEVAELAQLKRARIEQMKAMKKMKAAKTSTSSSNTLAFAFTIMFFLVIIFQGISPAKTTSSTLQKSSIRATVETGNLISVQSFGNLARPANGVSSSVDQVPILDLRKRQVLLDKAA